MSRFTWFPEVSEVCGSIGVYWTERRGKEAIPLEIVLFWKRFWNVAIILANHPRMNFLTILWLEFQTHKPRFEKFWFWSPIEQIRKQSLAVAPRDIELLVQRVRFGELLAHRNHLGIFAEDYDTNSWKCGLLTWLASFEDLEGRRPKWSSK